jgi:hypothetical protein
MMSDGLADVRAHVATMDEAIAEMSALGRGLPPDDGVAVFTAMYLQVTHLVADQVGQAFFAAPEFLARLDVVFANRYLSALSAAHTGQRIAACWRVLLERRHDRHVHPLQFALMGMSAHINHDLVLALNDVFAEQGRSPQDRAARADFARVNQVLAVLEPGIRNSLIRQAQSRFRIDVGHIEDGLARWSIARARALAWHDASVLWDVRHHPQLVRRMTASLDAAAAAASRCLAMPLSAHRSGTRGCGCGQEAPNLQALPESELA